jgi:hypothetical protein
MRIKLLLGMALLSSQIAYSQSEMLIYHKIKTDATGKILPWFSEEPGKAYSNVIQSVWYFWDTMRTDLNGLPYYMNHQVWKPEVNDARGIGGDQIQMALSSWRLLYQYTGNERIKENMRFMADYYLTHGLSPSATEWADIPYPYNTLIYSGIYDGDMVIGKNYTQPDKAGSFGIELINLYKITSAKRNGQTPKNIYLESAVKIANTLAKHTVEGDDTKSPLPFKVNALTGKPGQLLSNGDGNVTAQSIYTSNWSGTLELFLELIKMNKGEVILYQQAFDKILKWMKEYPLKNNKWGPFFEDVAGWSDTQINAITFAQFMMNHQEYFPDWKTGVNGIFNWVYNTLGNDTWKKYGVIVVNEQTAYRVPGNSHTSRQASAELQYFSLTGDSTRKRNAIRQLNWATYMVDIDGKNRYPQNDIWLTDGYGDYVRHYLRAMAVLPELSPADEEHILYSSSVIEQVEYNNQSDEKFKPGNNNSGNNNIRLRYTAFDKNGTEKIRLLKKPNKVLLSGKEINETENAANDGYKWYPLGKGGILTINRIAANEVTIID